MDESESIMSAHSKSFRLGIIVRTVFFSQHDATPLQKLHPAVLELGLAYSDGSLAGASARSIGMMLAMRCVVADFKAPENAAFSRALTSHVNACVAFLWEECRPACVPQRNSIKWLKSIIHNVRCPSLMKHCSADAPSHEWGCKSDNVGESPIT
jgi:hypothetical protein